MAKGLGTSPKSASKQKIQAGPPNKMNKGTKVGTQKPGVSSVMPKGGGTTKYTKA